MLFVAVSFLSTVSHAFVAPETRAATKLNAQPDLSLVPGVYPEKSMPADYGFDPLGLANYDLNLGSARDKARSKVDVVKDYRDAELRHGRLAMLAALAWPIQELASPSLAHDIGSKVLLTADGRSPSVLNGGLGAGPIPLVLLGTAAAIAALDLRALKIKQDSGRDWLPGDFGFDPLRILKGASPLAIKDMQAKEINNGRLAMLAIAAYVIQEFITGEPIVVTSEQLFTPIYMYPWFQAFLDHAFGIASFRTG
ncbi:hypothetical protein CTAYLR_004704 [Chrysophaeum taylorii]|uniref:Chlorophyll a-b binding protein, chloroplastic n=1 Tax=Chrysophaeum taylorii TaxID=2483200 RepID=A0AAD7U854_9STRA|nr:hypothetical protein CTAYLR_004704 [Chrysophaeum taylorii]